MDCRVSSLRKQAHFLRKVLSGLREARTGNSSPFAGYHVRDHGVNKLVKNWNDIVQLKEPIRSSSEIFHSDQSAPPKFG